MWRGQLSKGILSDTWSHSQCLLHTMYMRPTMWGGQLDQGILSDMLSHSQCLFHTMYVRPTMWGGQLCEEANYVRRPTFLLDNMYVRRPSKWGHCKWHSRGTLKWHTRATCGDSSIATAFIVGTVVVCCGVLRCVHVGPFHMQLILLRVLCLGCG